ncbi:putative SEC14-like protein 5 [Cardiosporidium cionae]|uniref:SEC14-like protein 5 n=1 Tax=Cardiosporidium cionae TaxID=476202 RepID=A0ABQ7J5A5_9APIC|nr:putative SEC14-like protein 5 [Cardiosporidium cionae]|eukprot:KAF8819185.1 putative SEC14-like protein 5 [Cardiosporidium cionae]
MWTQGDGSNSTSSVTGPSIEMPLLQTLLKEKKEEIAYLRLCVGKTLEKMNNFLLSDNCFLLRYVLSYRGDMQKSSEAVRKALEWRKKNSDFVKKAMNADHSNANVEFPRQMQPYLSAIRDFLAAWGHKSTRNGQPVVIVRISCCNFAALSRIIPADILCDYVLFSNEVEFWACDRLTRKTGWFHKTFRLIDLRGLSTKTFDRIFLKAFSASSQVAEFLHPQLVAKTILLNAPPLLRLVIDMVKKFGVSRRAMEKIWICKNQGSPSNDLSDVVTAIIDPNNIPSFLGGLCRCPFGCIPGTENDSTNPKVVNLEELTPKMEKQKMALQLERQSKNIMGKRPHPLSIFDDEKVLRDTNNTLPPRPDSLPGNEFFGDGVISSEILNNCTSAAICTTTQPTDALDDDAKFFDVSDASDLDLGTKLA